MNKTIKLYDDNAYATEFEASVVCCTQISDGKYGIILDKTLFFPEEGGQSCDNGTLNGITVDHVSIKDNVITNITQTPIEEGAAVCGKIDFGIRYRNMQNHSGEHIVSGLIHSRYGFANVGFHLGSTEMTMDYDGVLTVDQLNEIEDAANRCVYENIQIIANYPDSQELKELSYRSKLDITEGVRIVTIPGYDICACCAPHVARTGEIGIIKFVEAEKYKGGIRIHAHCGFDALLDYREKNNAAGKISSLLSVKKHEIADGVERILSENLRLSAEKADLTAKLCKNIAENVQPTSGIACVFEQGIGASGMRIIANTVAQKSRAVAVFDKKADSEYSFVIASQHGIAKELMSLLSQKFNIKGGGSDKMVQGTACGDACEIEKLLKSY